MNFSKSKNKYVILGVTGPNEYENNVDNNWYTNYIARWCLQYTAQQIETGKSQWPDQLSNLLERIAFKDDEINHWNNIAKNMYLPFDEKLNVYLQQDGFWTKK